MPLVAERLDGGSGVARDVLGRSTSNVAITFPGRKAARANYSLQLNLSSSRSPDPAASAQVTSPLRSASV